MRRVRLFLSCFLVAVIGSSLMSACGGEPSTPNEQPQVGAGAVLFEGARLIIGDGTTVDDSAFLVENSRFSRVGRRGEIELPSGATRVDLTGKTVMPTLIDAHNHLGYNDIRKGTYLWENYTRENLVETMQRFAYYGVGAAMTMGNDGGHGDIPWKLREEEIPDGARFLSAGGAISQPGEGHAGVRKPSWYAVTSGDEARAAIRDLASHKANMVKILVDDRVGEIPHSMPPSIYGPLIEEAHKHNLRVAAHMMYLKDVKGLLRANIDGFAHMIRDRQGTESDMDEEVIEMLRKRQQQGVCNPPDCEAPWPDVFFIALLPDPPNRGGFNGFIEYTKEDLPWIAESLPPAVLQSMRDVLEKPGRDRPDRDESKIFAVQGRNLTKLVAMNLAKIGVGTDSTERTAGWAAHIEMTDMMAAGHMTTSQIITAATKNNAEILRVHKDLGTVEAGKSASFIVLDANPLEDIKNMRRINQVYLRGKQIDRAALRAKLTRS